MVGAERCVVRLGLLASLTILSEQRESKETLDLVPAPQPLKMVGAERFELSTS